MGRKPAARIGRLALPVVTLLLFWVPAGAAELPGITPFQIHAFAANCLQLLERENLSAVAALFHLDPNMDPPQQQLERAEIAARLAGVFAEFGRPAAAEILVEPRQAHQFVLQGLSSRYWQQFSRFHPAAYRVRYTRAGDGYLTLAIVVYDRRLQLRAVSFGLPVERADSEEIVRKLLRTLAGPTQPIIDPQEDQLDR